MNSNRLEMRLCRVLSAILVLLAIPSEATSCQDVREASGTLWSQQPQVTLHQAGFVASFNGIPLDQLDGLELPVGSAYSFEIAHDEFQMDQGFLEFELDWSSMVHSKMSCVQLASKLGQKMTPLTIFCHNSP